MLSVHVDTGREWRGGQAQVLHLAEGLRAAGDRPILVTPAGVPLQQRAEAAGLEVRTAPLRGEWDVASIRTLTRWFRELTPTVVHSHTAHGITLAGVAARRARVPVVVAARRVDFPVSLFGRWKLRWLADRVVCVSHAIGDVLRRCGVDPTRLSVIHSGVPMPPPANAATRERMRRVFGVASGALVGALGALVDHKDHRTLIEAAALLAESGRPITWLIAGEGPLRSSLEQLAAERGIAESLRLVGFRDDVQDVLAALDLYVLCSHHEGLGTSVLDALAAARPVVATRVGGVPEMIEEGRSGVLIEPRDPAGLAAAIVGLLDDRARASRMAAAGRHRVAKLFTTAQMVDATRSLYGRLLASHNRHARASPGRR